MAYHKDRIGHAVSAGGTGALTLGSAVTKHRAFVAGDDARLFPYVIEDGDAWETGYGTYTHSGTSYARTTRIDSSTGSALNVTTAAEVYVTWIADLGSQVTSIARTYSRGGLVTRSSATAIAASACDYWDDTVGGLVSYAGGTLSPSLGANQSWSVFLANGTLEAFNEVPPSTTYAGTARKRATGNGGRFIGWFLTNASSQIYSMEVVEIANAVKVVFTETTSSAPFRVLSGGTSTSYAAVSLAGCVPRYIATAVLMTQYLNYSTTAGDGLLAELSLNGTNRFGAVEMYVPSTASFPNLTGELPLEIATPQVHYRLSVRGAASGPAFYLDVSGFTMSR